MRSPKRINDRLVASIFVDNRSLSIIKSPASQVCYTPSLLFLHVVHLWTTVSSQLRFWDFQPLHYLTMVSMRVISDLADVASADGSLGGKKTA